MRHPSENFLRTRGVALRERNAEIETRPERVEAEAELVRSLLELRQTLETQKTGEQRSTEVEAAKAQVVNLINTFYRDRLVVMPTIKEYTDKMQAEAAAH